MTNGLSSHLRRSVAWVLIVLMAGLSFGPVIHAGIGHDVDCDPIIVVHDASQHRLSTPPTGVSPQSHEDHCIVCHWFRFSRGLQTAGVCGSRGLEAGDAAPATPRFDITSVSVVPLPARAPPAILI